MALANNSLAEDSAGYDKAYEECDNVVSEKIDYSENYTSWEKEFDKCMKEKGFETEDSDESDNGQSQED